MFKFLKRLRGEKTEAPKVEETQPTVVEAQVVEPEVIQPKPLAPAAQSTESETFQPELVEPELAEVSAAIELATPVAEAEAVKHTEAEIAPIVEQVAVSNSPDVVEVE